MIGEGMLEGYLAPVEVREYSDGIFEGLVVNEVFRSHHVVAEHPPAPLVPSCGQERTMKLSSKPGMFF